MVNYCARCFVKKTLRTAILLGLTIVVLNLNFSGAWNGLAEPQQSAAAPSPAPSISPEKLTLMLEALKRLPADQVQKNPALTQKVRSLAEAAMDRPEYLELVRKFKIPGQLPALSQIAVTQFDTNSGAEAVRLLFMLESENWWQDVLEKTPIQDRAAWALVLKNSADPQAVDALEWILTEPESEPAAMKSAVQGLTRFQKGAERLLALAESQKLPASVRLLSSSLLNDVAWESIQSRASEILPLPPTKDPQPLPSITELIQRKGNVESGKAVFLRAESLCAICHIAEDQGADFGPALSEIGAKLGKDALYDAILDPNAGVSFGYETTTLTLDTGDSVMGIIASETDQTIVLKFAGGITAPYEKESILDRSTEPVSMMPAGLQRSMTTQELIDLIEYLTSLKKVEKH